MAMCGMSGFLETELANDNAELQNYGDNKALLLFAVLEDYLTLNQYNAGADFITSPSKSTVRVLLQKGADPYQLHRGRSAHSIATAMACRGDKDFIEVLKILKDHKHPSARRRRLNTQVQSLPGECTSTVSPSAPLTEENIKQIDASHGQRVVGYQGAVKGSLSESHSTIRRSGRGPKTRNRPQYGWSYKARILLVRIFRVRYR